MLGRVFTNLVSVILTVFLSVLCFAEQLSSIPIPFHTVRIGHFRDVETGVSESIHLVQAMRFLASKGIIPYRVYIHRHTSQVYFQMSADRKEILSLTTILKNLSPQSSIDIDDLTDSFGSQIESAMVWVSPIGSTSGVSLNPINGTYLVDPAARLINRDFVRDDYESYADLVSFDYGFNRYDPYSDRAYNGGVGGDVRGLYTYGAITNDSTTYGLNSYFTDGWLSVGFRTRFNLEEGQLWGSSEGGAIGIGAFVGGWKNYIGVGLNVEALLPYGLSVQAGGFASISADRIFHLVGAYKGEDQNLSDFYRVEIEDHRGVSGYAQGGVYFGEFIRAGIGAKLGLSADKKKVLRTFMPMSKVKELLEEKSHNFLLRYLTLRSKKVEYPQFHDPMSLRPYDELIQEMSGTMYGSFAGGVRGLLKAGASASLQGNFEFALRRLPPDEHSDKVVEVSITPKNVTEVGLFSEAAGFLGMNISHEWAYASKQNFQFDLNNPDARIAYQNLFHGKLPGASTMLGLHVKSEAKKLIKWVRADNIQLKKRGIKRTLVERMAVPAKRFFIGSKIHWLAPFGVSGLSYEKMKGKSRSLVANEEMAITQMSRLNEGNSEKLISGKESEHVHSTIKEVHFIDPLGNFQTEYDGFEMKWSLSDSRVIRHEDKKLLKKINHYFFLNLSGTPKRPCHYSRDFSVSRMITPLDVANMKLTDEVKKRLRVRTYRVARLLRKLKCASSAEQGVIMQEFVRKHDVAGMSALHQLAGGRPQDLSLNTANNLYSKNIEKMNDFDFVRAEGEDEIKVGHHRFKVMHFFRKMKKWEKKVEMALNFLEVDPFYGSRAPLVSPEPIRRKLLMTWRKIQRLKYLKDSRNEKERVHLYKKNKMFRDPIHKIKVFLSSKKKKRSKAIEYLGELTDFRNREFIQRILRKYDFRGFEKFQKICQELEDQLKVYTKI